MTERKIIVTMSEAEVDPQRIEIGRARTHGTRRVLFDCGEVLRAVGAVDSVKLWYAPPCSDPCARTLDLDNGVAAWSITAEDTAHKGSGECQLFFYTAGGGLWKSSIFQVSVLADIG